MQTSSADTLVPGCPSTVHDEVLALAARVWGVRPDDVVTSEAGGLLVHRVRLDGETSCWLTWTFTAAGPSLTRVHLSHDEAALGDNAPDPDLDAVLGMLLTAVMPTQAAADRTREETS
jgi:hypothetical protein